MSDNPVAIVTGGSRGVGAATAKMLSENGWNVVITCSSSIKDADQVAKNCTHEKAEVIALKADVSKDIECIATINKAIENGGELMLSLIMLGPLHLLGIIPILVALLLKIFKIFTV